MAGENEERKDVNIGDGGAGANAGNQHSTQTRESGAGDGGGNSQPGQGGDDGAGTGGGGSSGGSGEGDAFTPDADGKYTHPGTKEKVDAVELAKYYRDQHGASTRGAQELLTQKADLESKLGEATGNVEKLTKDLEDLRKIAEGKNPEGLKLTDLQGQLEGANKKLAVLEENALLDAFEKSEPLAASKREALRSLARANPKTPIQKLWDDNLKAGAIAEKQAADDKKKAQEAGAGEKGKGTSTREPQGGGNTVSGTKGDTGLTIAEFNALPVAKRRDLIENYDIRM